MRGKDKKSNKKKSSLSGTGILIGIFVLGLLVLSVLFLVNWERIAGNFKSTGFFEKMGLETPGVVENTETPSRNENDVLPTGTVSINLNETEDEAAPQRTSEAVSPQNEAAQERMEQAREQTSSAEGGASPSSSASQDQSGAGDVDVIKQAVVTTNSPSTPATMDLTLYFMTINSSGEVSSKSVVRRMQRSDSPLVDAVNALIAGPDADEESSGCRTLVSDGTRLLGASVKDGTATLNFNENFEFNRYGIEGLRGQLQQIVFTATAFPTVDNVQFLVSGEKRDYLGSEGVWIGSPLDRYSF